MKNKNKDGKTLLDVTCHQGFIIKYKLLSGYYDQAWVVSKFYWVENYRLLEKNSILYKKKKIRKTRLVLKKVFFCFLFLKTKIEYFQKISFSCLKK